MAKRPTKRGSRNASVPIAVPRGETESLRIREISNGFLITREGTKRGKYFSHEEYSPTKPVITAGAAPKTAKGRT